MGLVSKSEFAKMCGLPTNRLSVEIKRGKVSMTGDKIDLDTPINQQFLQKYQEKKGVQPATKEPGAKDVTEGSREMSAGDMRNIDNIKKVEEVERIRVDTRIKKIKEKQLQGQNIPTEIVKSIVTQLAKSFTARFHISCDNFLMEIGKRKDLTRKEIADIRGSLIEIINDGVNKSVDETKKALKALISETSGKRGVGEHD